MIFGGKNEENEKLNDLWAFNFTTQTWERYQANMPLSDESMPLPRSGHSAAVHQQYMVIFGGIFDVTKELDDMSMYDLEKRRWTKILEDHAMMATVQKRLNFSGLDGSNLESGPSAMVTQSDINSTFVKNTSMSPPRRMSIKDGESPMNLTKPGSP